jgi:hypothetical protein
MASPRRKIIIVCVLAFLVLIGFFAFRTKPQPYPNPPQTLPDGSVLTLLKVDYGKTNELIEGTWFQKTFRRFIPNGGTSILGLQIKPPVVLSGYYPEKDTLVFWLRRTVPQGKSIRLFDTAASWQSIWILNTYAAAFDENGNEYNNQAGTIRSGSPTNHLISIEIPAFPRNGKMVGIRLFQHLVTSDWKQVAEFKTPNPTPGPHLHWKPNPLPDSHKIDNVEFSLASLRVHPPHVSSSSTSSSVRSHWSKYWTVPEFEISEDGHSSTNWTPNTAFIYEANGNCHGPHGVKPQPQNGYLIEDSLNPAEPWKLRVEFCRTSGFAPSDLWTVSNLSFSSASGVLASTNIHGAKVDILFQVNRLLSIDFPDKATDLSAVILNVVDDNSKHFVSHPIITRPKQVARVQIVPSYNATSLSVTIAVTKSVWVDFLAQPTMEKEK